MPLKYDVVVVGAGPAGSMAAFEVADAGYSVLLLEKHKKPGVPLCCAEAVSRPSLENLISPRPEWVSTYIEKVKMVAPSGDEAIIRHPRAGYVLDRKVFDYDLAQRAVDAGGTLQCETIGTELSEENGLFRVLKIMNPLGRIEEIRAQIFIAADGVESKVARFSGVNNLIEKGIESILQYRLEDINVDPEMLEFHIGKDIAPRGYTWVFPKSEHSANVGLGISTEQEKGSRTLIYLDRFIKKRFGKYRIAEKNCGLVPRYQGEKMFRKANLLVVGDAARSVDSLSGAGIINAMLSGRYAGLAAVEYISGRLKNIEQIEKYYPGKFLKKKGDELRLYLKLRNIYDRLNDDDFTDIIHYLSDYFGERTITDIKATQFLVGIVTTRPSLLRFARYLL